ncbi:MAG: helix-turn-helix transcriptional regulator [Clostridia bacterium]|nr:helix-turn-helix transcriptional regulator [Clostridia bacterium]
MKQVMYVVKTNIRKLRKERGLTQIALQMATGIDQALLSKFETGERLPTTDALIVLADYFNVSIDYLLCRTEHPNLP